MEKQKIIDELNHSLLVWKHQQKKRIADKIRSLLVDKKILDDVIEKIIIKYIDE